MDLTVIILAAGQSTRMRSSGCMRGAGVTHAAR